MTPTQQQLRLSGWLSFFLAISYPMTFLLSIAAGFSENRELSLVNAFLGIITAGCYCYIYLSLKEYFEHRLRVSAFTRFINIFVAGTLLLTFMNVLSYMFAGFENLASFLMLVILCVFGITSILFGLNLLKLKDDLFKLRNMLGYSNILGGVFVTSLILFPLAAILEFLVYIILGIMLLRASEE